MARFSALAVATAMAALSSERLLAAAKDQTSEGSANPYMDYVTQSADNQTYSRKIENPAQCFGNDFEVFQQLQSPEWQLCEGDGGLHMCSTESPLEIQVRWMKNNVQEDSFQLDLRRKTAWVATDFFLAGPAADYYKTNCPIDNNYAKGDNGCSGSYVNGSFNFYPPFSYDFCQCAVAKQVEADFIKEQEDLGSDGEEPCDAENPYIKCVHNKLQTLTISAPESPCYYKLMNSTRKDKQMPNNWSEMNTKRINLKMTQIPEGGEVHLFGSFAPDFWLNQPKTVKHVVDVSNTEHSFKSTDEIWILTRCKTAECAAGTFEIEYKKIVIKEPAEEFPEWSMIITIYVGFSLMLIAFLYFEWRTLLKCVKKCQERGCGKNGQSQIYADASKDLDDDGKLHSQESINDSQEAGIDDDQLMANLDRVKQKAAENEPHHGFDEYASNRQD